MLCLRMTLPNVVYLLYIIPILGPGSYGNLVVPGLDREAYIEEGDINIGLLRYIHRYSDGFCSDSYRTSGAQNSEVGKFMTDRINKDDELLPNITLGFVVLDDCQKDLTALARSVYFVSPDNEQEKEAKRRRVVGVVGPIYSRQSVMVSSFLGLFQIPVLSTYSTSDELSDTSRFPYFMRLVSPDAFQSVALVDIIEYFGWTYVSLLYSEGSYGENAAKNIERLTRSRGICLGVSKRISSDPNDEEVKRVLLNIQVNNDAPVVILFMESMGIDKLFGYILKNNMTSNFLWVSGDSFPAIDSLGVAEGAIGSLYVGHPSYHMPQYKNFIKGLSWKSSKNPWLPLIYKSAFGCTWNVSNDPDKESCEIYDTLSEAQDLYVSSPGKSSDGFMVYAKALHNLITDHCPHLFRKDVQRDFSDCINGPRLLQYMKAVSFSGFTGQVEFDSKGDMQGMYVIRQYRKNKEGAIYKAIVGEWTRSTNSLYLNMSKLDWGETRNLGKLEVESLCSRPCDIGHYYQNKEVSCCWECVKCRDNEITVNNLTGCEACPDFTWPDSQTVSECVLITPYYLQMSQVVSLCLVCLAAIGALTSVAIIVVYIAKPHNRLLKATSRGLSICILVGCMLACLASVLFLTYPDRSRCLLRQTGFHLVVCIMYSPLLLKTSRVYRIFSAGKRGTGRPKFTSTKSQLVFSFIFILCQVGIITQASHMGGGTLV